MHRRMVIFAGHVQGVGFRATAQAIAGRFRVSGWVRNEPDSTVRLEIQGPPEEIEAMVRTIGERMRHSITGTRSEELAVVPEESGFEIRR